MIVVQQQKATQRAGTAARRQDILTAAMDCFIQDGFDATSLRQIAVRATMTHAGVLHHFENKEALVAALLQRRDEQDEEFVRHVMQQARPNSGRAPALFALLAHNRQSPGEMRFWNELCAAASRPGHSSQVYFAARYKSLRFYMEEVLRRRAQAGALREGVRPELVAMLLPAVLDGLQSQWLLDQRLALDEAVDHFLSLLLRPGATLADDTRAPIPDQTVRVDDGSGSPPFRNGSQRIVTAAVELFTARGFDGTSITDIAEEAGYSKASVLYHFATKEELLQVALRPLNEAIEVLVLEGRSSSAAGGSGVSALVELCIEHRALLALIAGLTPAARTRWAVTAWEVESLTEVLVGNSTPREAGKARFAMAAIPTFCRQSSASSDEELREHLATALQALLGRG